MTEQPLWQPPVEQVAASNMTRFASTAASRWSRGLDDYAALHQWSVREPGEFWTSIWEWPGSLLPATSNLS